MCAGRREIEQRSLDTLWRSARSRWPAPAAGSGPTWDVCDLPRSVRLQLRIKRSNLRVRAAERGADGKNDSASLGRV